ncbi:MAG: hypothetical protein A3B30_00995 [Candidatus Komeilibacteria bacterium RIFCSPLOWO2_01_FULL_52_15]|uniref:Uncharacterized protein n=1 Tax=Candidatus Komeilibacteria bacterium RIFCSPLOWO2_01_FULL_52_15 TaxID=1798551 RepID=A0A1G2BS43_9BACT|nr:MAG: hypothetical protein A3B30_00995 [Candidatus Komeilibacteria bacterium RIFCSPLOWO2_01_FULL_52_15]
MSNVVRTAVGRRVVIAADAAFFCDQGGVDMQVVLTDQSGVNVILSDDADDITPVVIGVPQVRVDGDVCIRRRVLGKARRADGDPGRVNLPVDP